ncbi:MAG: ATP-binding cassette domain-containing protein [Leptospiraceae bacterium]|nr:ATP-binding cassette domain-containing protein [Leptospiraceae bacterium]
MPSKKTKCLSGSVTHIQFDNVSFAYGNTTIFNNLNLLFEKGKSYAIVGQTGSGKSTLLDLIMDFNTPASGQVFIDGINTQEIDEKSLANKILYIGQDAIIFNDTIRKNLEINTHYEEETISKILSLSCLEETIASFENGLEYLLQYRGTNISGGQKQRINLARALLRNPDVLILDESVNALDEITRQKVVENIKSEFQNKIIIFVTHDRDILNFVDEIIDLDSLKEKND